MPGRCCRRSRPRAAAEPAGKDTLRATTTGIGKGRHELRDVPQSVTVVTEKLIDDRNLDTLKDALKQTAGIAFQAAEGGEEDIRLRGFSLQASGDIFIDGMRDPAFYERDTFNWDRLELLRGSASMLFGRGSTGGAANQVSKQPFGMTMHEVAVTLGSGGYLRAVGDFNLRTGDDAALRINAMVNVADHGGAGIDKRGVAPTFRWGIGTRDEFQVGAYVLRNDNGIHYGLPWLTPGTSGGNYLWPTDPRQPLRHGQRRGSQRHDAGACQPHPPLRSRTRDQDPGARAEYTATSAPARCASRPRRCSRTAWRSPRTPSATPPCCSAPAAPACSSRR